MPKNKVISAFVWDFDGTLVNSFPKNLAITKAIVTRVTGSAPDDFHALRTLEDYVSAQHQHENWRSFYIECLGLTEEQTDAAGRLWSEYQQRDETPTPFFDGLASTFEMLRAYPHGIVSQNARAYIERCLNENSLSGFFRCIVGYQEVPLRTQKPAPEGLVMCIQRLTTLASGCVFYLGDHEADVLTAKNANRAFEEAGLGVRVVTIAAAYSSDTAISAWDCKPDYVARSPHDILAVLKENEASS